MSNGTSKSKIGAIVYSVSSLDRTIAFYSTHFGLSFTKSEGEDGGEESKFAYANVGEITMVFFERTEKAGRSPVIVFELEGEIDALTEKLARAGVTIVTPVSHAPGGWSSDFLDPDGHQLSYYQEASKPRRL